MTGLLFACSSAYAQDWKELVVNGDFEGSDLSSFTINIKDGDSRTLAADEIVVDDKDASNHCAKLAFTEQPYKTQFIIKFSEPLTQGNLFKFSMNVKSSSTKDLNLRTTELGIFKVKGGGEWSTCSYEGIVTPELNGCQTITCGFDRGPKKTDMFFFDNITAQEKTPKIIEFADPLVKEICIRHWDTNADGELDEAEAASVTDLGDWFMSSQITSFDEFQYFTGLTKLSDGAFYGCSFLKNIILPNNITEIESNSSWLGAFKWCYNMTSATLGDNIVTIGDDAFYHCSQLASVNIPKKLCEIGTRAFYGCSSIPALTIPRGVERIGDNAFQGCSSLNTIVVEDGNKKFDSRDNCNALIQTETNTLMLGSAKSFIPNTVTAIASEAFNGNVGLTSITIPKSVTNIGSDAFSGCSGLVSIIVEEGNPTYDSRDNCNALIETAKDYLIKGSNNSRIPQSVQVIAPYAFSYCSGLTSVNIPSAIKSIGENAFQGCSGLNTIVVEEGNTVYDSRNNCNALIETAKDSLMLGCKNTSIPDGVTVIAPNAFYNCSELTSIAIPNGVTTIYEYAFYGCTGLTFVSIPNSVKAIRGATFSGCQALSTVVLGNSMELIESFAFLGCASLQNVYCYAEQVPDAHGMYGNLVFSGVDLSKTTLHVPATSLEAYRAEDPWMYFGSIVALTDDDPKPTGITNVNQDIATDQHYYSLDGKRIATPRRGLNIIRMKDGTTRKVVVK
jgi:hypothetical protein